MDSREIQQPPSGNQQHPPPGMLMSHHRNPHNAAIMAQPINLNRLHFASLAPQQQQYQHHPQQSQTLHQQQQQMGQRTHGFGNGSHSSLPMQQNQSQNLQQQQPQMDQRTLGFGNGSYSSLLMGLGIEQNQSQNLQQQQQQQQQMNQRTLGFGNGSHSSLPMQQNESQNLQQQQPKKKPGMFRKRPLDDYSPNRKRGRPPGSSKKQLDALRATAGFGFTTHIIEVNTGEDIASKVMALTDQGPRIICVLSASGAVCRATLQQAAHYSAVTHEGRFEIITLSGSFSTYEVNGSTNRSGGLSVALAAPDGRIFGGRVAGPLVAATQVQVTVGSFVVEAKKQNQSSGNNVRGQNPEPAPAPANRWNLGSVSQGSSIESLEVCFD